MSFLLQWLFAKPRRKVGLRPHRDVQLALDFESAYDRTLQGIERALGAYVSIDDRAGGFIEAAFGLVNNERVRCYLERIDATHTAIRIEAFFPAGLSVPDRSLAVDALADMLARDHA
jgi:hypothetical protein